MKKSIQMILVALLACTGHCLAAESGEIDFLLRFIADSECTFIRNGKEYPASEASEHLRYKYSHVESRIKTADDFIARIASKSSISRKPYEVECGVNRIKSGPWLTDALRTHRERVGKE